MNLTDREWKEFKCEDIFDIYTGASIPVKDLIVGSIPRITASETNNGVVGYYRKMDIKNYRELNNFISVSFLGGVFYHPYTASLDMKIHAVKLPNKELTKELAMFLVRVIRQTVCRFSYGDQLSSTDLPRQKILLPIDDEGNPDFEFMENYTKKKEKIMIEKYNKYLESLDKLGGVTPTYKIYWQPYKISELFEIIKGNQNNMSEMNKGNIPLVSAKKIDNGYKDFMSENGKHIFPANIISLNNDGDGGAGIAYYQPSRMLLDSHCTALIPKFDNANKYSLLFIARTITKQRDKFGHGYSLNNTRLNNFKVILPQNEKGEIDYSYMEHYICERIRKQLIKYLEYKMA